MTLFKVIFEDIFFFAFVTKLAVFNLRTFSYDDPIGQDKRSLDSQTDPKPCVHENIFNHIS